jgi:hypothetical protein
MPYLKLSEVAARLDVKEYWLQKRLIEDERSSEPRLRFHHYLGTTRPWTHDAFALLKDAIADELAELRRSPGSGRRAKGKGTSDTHDSRIVAPRVIVSAGRLTPPESRNSVSTC